MPVVARFHELRNRVVATVDEKLAEPVRLSPMRGGSPDPDRPQRQIEAILRTGASKGGSIEGGQGRGWRSRLQSGTSELHIDRTKYPDVVLKKSDAVRAISRAGAPAFEVLAIDDRNHARLIISLGEK